MPRTTHGLSGHPLYAVWKEMHSRCCNPRNHKFKDYGGRGISVDPEWDDVRSFVSWAEGPGGWRRGLSLERKNNDKGYSSGNCCFADKYTQQNNRRAPVMTELGRSFHSYAVQQSGRRRKGIVYRQHSDDTALAALELRESRKTHREISEQLGVPFGGIVGLLNRGRKLRA